MLCKSWCKNWWKKSTPLVREGAIRQTIVATIPTNTNRFQNHYSPQPVRREPFEQVDNERDNDGLPTYEQVIKMNPVIQIKDN